jgi:hypothetical protein
MEEPTIAELRKEARDQKEVQISVEQTSQSPWLLKSHLTPQSSSKEKVKQKKDVPGSSESEKASRVKTGVN